MADFQRRFKKVVVKLISRCVLALLVSSCCDKVWNKLLSPYYKVDDGNTLAKADVTRNDF